MNDNNMTDLLKKLDNLKDPLSGKALTEVVPLKKPLPKAPGSGKKTLIETEELDELNIRPFDYITRKLKLKTTKGTPQPHQAPKWAKFMGKAATGAWYWLERKGKAEPNDGKTYYPDSGQTEFSGFVAKNLGNGWKTSLQSLQLGEQINPKQSFADIFKTMEEANDDKESNMEREFHKEMQQAKKLNKGDNGKYNLAEKVMPADLKKNSDPDSAYQQMNNRITSTYRILKKKLKFADNKMSTDIKSGIMQQLEKIKVVAHKRGIDLTMNNAKLSPLGTQRGGDFVMEDGAYNFKKGDIVQYSGKSRSKTLRGVIIMMKSSCLASVKFVGAKVPVTVKLDDLFNISNPTKYANEKPEADVTPTPTPEKITPEFEEKILWAYQKITAAAISARKAGDPKLHAFYLGKLRKIRATAMNYGVDLTRRKTA